MPDGEVGGRRDQPAAEGAGATAELEQRDGLGVGEPETGPVQKPRQAGRQMRLGEVPEPAFHHAAMPLAVGRQPDARIPVGIDDREAPPGPQDAGGLRQRALHVGDVEVDLDGRDEVERGGGEVEPGRVALPDLHAVPEPLAGDPGSRRFQHLGALVDPDDPPGGPHLAGQLAREERRPAPDVEAPLAGPDAEDGARPRTLGGDRGRHVEGLEPRHVARAELGGHPKPPSKRRPV